MTTEPAIPPAVIAWILSSPLVVTTLAQHVDLASGTSRSEIPDPITAEFVGNQGEPYERAAPSASVATRWNVRRSQ
jgi:hypothetical protein